MKSKCLCSSLLLGVVFLILGTSVFASVYDDFGKASIDPKKWSSHEFVREIQDGKLFLKATTYGVQVSNWLNFKNPSNISCIEAEVSVNDIQTSDKSRPQARIGGFFYNDGSAAYSGSYKGEVQAAIRIRLSDGQPRVEWTLWKAADDDGLSWNTLASGFFPDSISLKKKYKLSVLFEPSLKRFTFTVGTTVIFWTSTDATLNPSSNLWKAIGTDITFSQAGTSSLGSITATFDNVIARDETGNVLVSETFSSPMINPDTWSSFETVKEIVDKKLRSELRSVDQSRRNYLPFTNPKQIKDFRAKVTVHDFQNPDGASPKARLGGIFYNDTGDPNSRYSGDMWADVYIGGEGVTQQAGWVVRRLEDPEGEIDTIVDAGIFPIPITIGETYTLFLAWDGGRFTFKCNESILNYTPSTLIHPGNNEFRHIGTRVIPPSSGATEYSALISATFDDVLINETGPSINGKWLLDISGSDKGGAVLECSGNSLEGYGVTQTIGPFEMTGSYSVDKKGGISGTYALSPYESGALPYSGTLSGKVDSKVTKLSFKYSNPSISFSGIKLPAEPTIPEDWTVKISGGAKGTFDPFKIEPYEVEGDLIERVHKLSGSGSIQGVNGTVNIDGLFFLTQKNLVYGIYELSGGLSEEGSISGKFTPPSKFSLKAVSETGTKLNIDGQAVP